MFPDLKDSSKNQILTAHQKRVIEYILSTKQRGLLIVHGTGTGKTLTAIALLLNLMQKGEIQNAVIVGPASLTVQWNSNLSHIVPTSMQSLFKQLTYDGFDAAFKNPQKPDVGCLEGGIQSLIEAYKSDGLSSAQLQAGCSEALVGPIQGGVEPSALRGIDLTKTAVIFDEAHTLSNPSTKPSITAKYVAFRAKYIFCMTATPMKNGPNEASIHFNLFNVLFPTIGSSTIPPTPESQRYDFPGYMLTRKDPFQKLFVNDEQTNQKSENLPFLMNKQKCWISQYSIDQPGSADQKANFPRVIEIPMKDTTVQMSPQQQEIYKKLEQLETPAGQNTAEYIDVEQDEEPNRNNSFLVQTRKASNTVYNFVKADNFTINKTVYRNSYKNPALAASHNSTILEPKMQRMVRRIAFEIRRKLYQQFNLGAAPNPEGFAQTTDIELPVIVYSNFKEDGIFRVKELFKREYDEIQTIQIASLDETDAPDPFVLQTYDTNSRILTVTGGQNESQRMNVRYNLLSPTNQDVLMITSAGEAGIDTRGVRQVHLLEPPWNESIRQQIIGRAARFNSHAKLNEASRTVRVFNWMSSLSIPKESVDQHIFQNLVQRKSELVDNFMKLFKCVSIERLHFNVQEDECTGIPRLDSCNLGRLVQMPANCSTQRLRVIQNYTNDLQQLAPASGGAGVDALLAKEQTRNVAEIVQKESEQLTQMQLYREVIDPPQQGKNPFAETRGRPGSTLKRSRLKPANEDSFVTKPGTREYEDLVTGAEDPRRTRPRTEPGSVASSNFGAASAPEIPPNAGYRFNLSSVFGPPRVSSNLTSAIPSYRFNLSSVFGPPQPSAFQRLSESVRGITGLVASEEAIEIDDDDEVEESDEVEIMEIVPKTATTTTTESVPVERTSPSDIMLKREEDILRKMQKQSYEEMLRESKEQERAQRLYERQLDDDRKLAARQLRYDEAVLKQIEVEAAKKKVLVERDQKRLEQQAERDRRMYEIDRKHERIVYWESKIDEGLRLDNIVVDDRYEDIDDAILRSLCRKYPNSNLCREYKRNQGL